VSRPIFESGLNHVDAVFSIGDRPDTDPYPRHFNT